MTEFSPGTSPPPVSMPIRFFAMYDSLRSANQNDDGSRSYLIMRLLQRQTVLGEVERTWQVGVHDSHPIPGHALLDLELQRLPIGIRHYINVVISLRCAMETKGHAP